MQTILSILHASSSWVNEHLGWFFTNGNKQVQRLDGHAEGGASEL